MRYPAIFICTIITMSVAAHAGVNTWTPIGPGGGTVTGLAVDPNRPQRVYATTANAGVFTSVDAGSHWATANGGLDETSLLDTSLEAVAFAPDGTLFAGGFVIRRSSDGASWQKVSECGASQFAFDPFEPQTVYAVSSTSPCGFSKSTDGGTTWTYKFLFYNQAIAVHPRRRGLILVAGDFGIYRSVDSGSSWTLVEPRCAGQALLFDPLQPSRAYAGCVNSSLYPSHHMHFMVSLDAGKTWKNSGLPNLDVYVLAGVPGVPRSLYAGTNSGIYRTFDAGAHWKAIGLANEAVAAIALASTSSAPLYAGTGSRGCATCTSVVGHGVFLSQDAGASWVPASRGLAALNLSALAVDPTRPGRLYVASFSGVYRTFTEGNTWRPVGNGLIIPAVLGLVIPPAASATVYATTSDYRQTGRFFRSSDAGQTWVSSSLQFGFSVYSPPFPPFLTGPVVDPSDPAHILLASESLSESKDCGDTWVLTSAPCSFQGLAFAPSSPATVFGGGFGVAFVTVPPPGYGFWGVVPCGVQKSEDGGATWTASGLANYFIDSLAVDPTNSNVVYVGVSGPSKGIYKSTDAGTSWSPSGLDNVNTRLLVTDPLLPGVVYAVVQVSLSPQSPPILVSRDFGVTWNSLSAGLTAGEQVVALAIDPVSATIYAATGPSYVWTTVAPSQVYELTYTP